MMIPEESYVVCLYSISTLYFAAKSIINVKMARCVSLAYEVISLMEAERNRIE